MPDEFVVPPAMLARAWYALARKYVADLQVGASPNIPYLY
jgi:hypothetical protein